MSAAAEDLDSTRRKRRRAALLAEKLRRIRARKSLVHYALSIDIPGTPIGVHDTTDPVSDEEAAQLRLESYLREVAFRPVESRIARHHVVMLERMQWAMENGGRLMILAPPGSAKSSYASVVAPTWAMGRWPRHKIILASYASRIARKQSRRAMQIARQRGFVGIFGCGMQGKHAAADDWAISNGSEYMAAGILAGITGNRANGIVCDDLIAGRQEAESDVIRESTMDAYRDDLMSRLLPGGWIIFINTRWHEEDPCGQILPADYRGESGFVRCRDGLDWYVLNMPAKAEREDDPVGRKIGEYLWPEWIPASHWQRFEHDPGALRTWTSLYQQRPTADGMGDFKREWFQFYTPDELPKQLRIYGASDYAVTDPAKRNKALAKRRKDDPDWTEHGVVGMDSEGRLYFLAWWSGRKTPDVSVDAWLDLVKQWRPIEWWNEGGIIDKSIRPLAERRMRERQVFTVLESLPSIADKRANCQAFRGRAAAGTVYFPANSRWAEEVIEQLVKFGATRFDDKYDVCGLIGRGIAKMIEAREDEPEGRRGLVPFTEEWLEHDEYKRPTGRRYR